MQLQQTADPQEPNVYITIWCIETEAYTYPIKHMQQLILPDLKMQSMKKWQESQKKKKIVRLLKTGITAKAISTAQRLFAQ